MSPVVRAAFALVLAVSTLPAAELNGIWTGLAPGRHGAKKDVAFQFKSRGQTLSGTLFGDEFDLPIEDGTLVGDKAHFTITTTNYYSGAKVKFLYDGEITGDLMQVTVERVLGPGEKPPEEESLKNKFTLKRLIP